MAHPDDSEIVNFIKTFSQRDIRAINRTEYVQKIITNLKQEIPAYIKSDYNHLKKVCTDQVNLLLAKGTIHFESIRSEKSVCIEKNVNRAQRRKFSSRLLMTPDRRLKRDSERPISNGDRLQSPQTSKLFVVPTTNLSLLAIKEETKESITRIISCLNRRDFFKNSNLTSCVGAIINGFPGSGKTQFVNAIAGEHGLPLLKVSGIDLVTDFKKNAEEKVRDLFAVLRNNQPAILLIDDLDAAFSGHGDQSAVARTEERRLTAQLCQCMDSVALQHDVVLVFATTSNIGAIDASLRRPGRFEYEIDIPMPDEKTRIEILRLVCQQLSLDAEVDLEAIARYTPGYVAGDLVACVREAALLSFNRMLKVAPEDPGARANKVDSQVPKASIVISQTDLAEASRIVKPSSTREGFSMVRDVKWEDVGGMELVKKHLSLAITVFISK